METGVGKYVVVGRGQRGTEFFAGSYTNRSRADTECVRMKSEHPQHQYFVATIVAEALEEAPAPKYVMFPIVDAPLE